MFRIRMVFGLGALALWMSSCNTQKPTDPPPSGGGGNTDKRIHLLPTLRGKGADLPRVDSVAVQLLDGDNREIYSSVQPLAGWVSALPTISRGKVVILAVRGIHLNADRSSVDWFSGSSTSLPVDPSGDTLAFSLEVRIGDVVAPQFARNPQTSADTVELSYADSVQNYGWAQLASNGVYEPLASVQWNGVDQKVKGDSVAASRPYWKVRKSLKVGLNVDSLVARDAAGNRTAVYWYHLRLPKPIDKTAPAVSLEAPVQDSTVLASTDSVYTVLWHVSDENLKEVRIDNVPVQPNDVALDGSLRFALLDNPIASGATVRRELIAEDMGGRKTSYKVIFVRPLSNDPKDVTAPSFSRLAPFGELLKSYLLPAGQTGLDVAWRVQDPGLKQVLLDSVPVLGDADIFRKHVELKAGTSIKVMLAAVDRSGNVAFDTVEVVRGTETVKDILPPVVHRLLPVSDLVQLAWSDSILKVRWSVYDDSLDVVTLDGGAPLLPDSVRIDGTKIYQLALTVGAGKDRSISLQAKDKGGRTTTSSFSVIRLNQEIPPDVTAPRAVRQSPFANGLGLGKDSVYLGPNDSVIRVSWQVTDDSLRWVKLAGIEVVGKDNLYSMIDTLAYGETRLYKLQALDKASNVTIDSVHATRAPAPDRTPPVVQRRAPLSSKDTLVVFGSPVSVAWNVSLDADSVKINGKLQTLVNGVASIEVSPAVGQIVQVALWAVDVSGNAVLDTIWVQRLLKNSAPSFIKGSDVAVNEDAGSQLRSAWALDLNAGTVDESGQILSFNVTTNNDALFFVKPAIDALTGNLTFTPSANASGVAKVTVVLKDNGGVANGGIDTSEAQIFTIRVNAVNDAPSFTMPTTLSYKEDAGAIDLPDFVSAISVGPSNEAIQTQTWTISSTNPGLFAEVPTLVGTTLKFKLAPEANGSSVITIRLQDNGGTDLGGVDALEKTTTVTVNPINDAPGFHMDPAITVLEDVGLVTLAGVAVLDSVGPANEASQAPSYTVTFSNAALFSLAPTITNGTLKFQTAANANGSSTLRVRLKDNGGTLLGGIDSMVKSLVLTVTPVNDQPSFVLGAVASAKNYEAKSIPGWASSLDAGAPNESPISSFQVTVPAGQQSIFDVLPTISANGTLSFTPKANTSGTATVSVKALDPDGTENAGISNSITQVFTIDIQDTVMDAVGNAYPFKKFGTQIWMTQNMRSKAGSPGERAPCNGKSGCDTLDWYGSGYSWAEGLGLPTECNGISCSNLLSGPVRGVCPIGWHVPTEGEWTTLETWAGGVLKLRARFGFCHSNGTCQQGTDDFGFTQMSNAGTGGYPGWSVSFSRMWLPEEFDSNTPYSRVNDNRNTQDGKGMTGGIRCLAN